MLDLSAACFSMLFLSQVLGEEEDEERREELIEALTKADEFSIQAQTAAGGWGYVGGKDGNDFDEGSTTITQVQGLRAFPDRTTIPGPVECAVIAVPANLAVEAMESCVVKGVRAVESSTQPQTRAGGWG